jgi:hypothetical protein
MCFFSLQHVAPPRGGMGLGSCWSSLASSSSSLVGTRPAWMVRVPSKNCVQNHYSQELHKLLVTLHDVLFLVMSLL